MTYFNPGDALKNPKQFWRTPEEIFMTLDAQFKFDIDLFADKDNALCYKFFSKENSAYDNDWCGKAAFGNPEYRKGEIAKALNKAVEEVHFKKNLETVVLLVPLTTPKWFERAISTCRVELFTGRIQFELPEEIRALQKKDKGGRAGGGNNAGSMLIIVDRNQTATTGVVGLRDNNTGQYLRRWFTEEI